MVCQAKLTQALERQKPPNGIGWLLMLEGLSQLSPTDHIQYLKLKHFLDVLTNTLRRNWLTGLYM